MKTIAALCTLALASAEKEAMMKTKESVPVASEHCTGGLLNKCHWEGTYPNGHKVTIQTSRDHHPGPHPSMATHPVSVLLSHHYPDGTQAPFHAVFEGMQNDELFQQVKQNKNIHGLNKENVRHFNNAFMKASSKHFHDRELSHIQRMFHTAHDASRQPHDTEHAELKQLSPSTIQISSGKTVGKLAGDFNDLTVGRKLLIRGEEDNNLDGGGGGDYSRRRRVNQRRRMAIAIGHIHACAEAVRFRSTFENWDKVAFWDFWGLNNKPHTSARATSKCFNSLGQQQQFRYVDLCNYGGCPGQIDRFCVGLGPCTDSVTALAIPFMCPWLKFGPDLDNDDEEGMCNDQSQNQKMQVMGNIDACDNDGMDSWNYPGCDPNDSGDKSGYWIQGRAEVEMEKFNFECDSGCRWGIDGTEWGDEEVRFNAHKEGNQYDNSNRLEEWFGQGERYSIWKVPRPGAYFFGVDWDEGSSNGDGFGVVQNRWYPEDSDDRPITLGWKAPNTSNPICDPPAFQTRNEEWLICGWEVDLAFDDDLNCWPLKTTSWNNQGSSYIRQISSNGGHLGDLESRYMCPGCPDLQNIAGIGNNDASCPNNEVLDHVIDFHTSMNPSGGWMDQCRYFGMYCPERTNPEIGFFEANLPCDGSNQEDSNYHYFFGRPTYCPCVSGDCCAFGDDNESRASRTDWDRCPGYNTTHDASNNAYMYNNRSWGGVDAGPNPRARNWQPSF